MGSVTRALSSSDRSSFAVGASQQQAHCILLLLAPAPSYQESALTHLFVFGTNMWIICSICWADSEIQAQDLEGLEQSVGRYGRIANQRKSYVIP
ncbi:hypothetical protein X742_27005 [Mesorhizobium sp. LNHC232B00]|nr:hypothetical protein X742_27005 [Mesorhizobium sp. LNHC232B00]